jgi:hypothetical protein
VKVKDVHGKHKHQLLYYRTINQVISVWYDGRKNRIALVRGNTGEEDAYVDYWKVSDKMVIDIKAIIEDGELKTLGSDDHE